MSVNKIRIGVLMGGLSLEREVSLNSGRTVCDHLDTSSYDIIPLFQTESNELFVLPWHFLHRGKTSDFEKRLAIEGQKVLWSNLKKIIDLVYIAQHGRYGEDGIMQGMFEVLGIPYCGSKVLASALGMNKAMQREFLKIAGIDVPHAVVINAGEVDKFDLRSVLYPCIVKPVGEGSSLGVSVVKNAQEMEVALKKASGVNINKVQDVLIEEFLIGMEFSCIVLSDVNGNWFALPPTEIELESGTLFFDYQQKYMPGKATKFTPARCSEELLKKIQDSCIMVAEALGLQTIGRIDGFLLVDGRVVIVDPNTFSGMDPASFAFLQAAQINMTPADLINHIIKIELLAYGMISTEEKQATLLMENKRLRVAVLMGGRSNEKEISLTSGRNIVYKMLPDKYEAVPIFVSSKLELYRIDQRLLVRNKTSEIEAGLQEDMRIDWDNLKSYADFVFLGLHGGEGENGSIQGTLELLGIPYNGSSVLASALCMDKFKTNQLLKSKGLNVPDGMLVSAGELENALSNIDWSVPRIVKPHDDGCSIGVTKVFSIHECKEASDAIFATGKQYVLIEECILGVELTVGVVGNDKPRALPPSMALSSAGILSIEEKFLPGAGENQTPAPLEPEVLTLVKRTVEEVYSIVGCKGYARIDCFYQPAHMSPTGLPRVIILEVNTLPGMTPATCIFHQAAEVGLRPMEFIDLIIELGLQAHAPHLATDISARLELSAI